MNLSIDEPDTRTLPTLFVSTLASTPSSSLSSCNMVGSKIGLPLSRKESNVRLDKRNRRIQNISWLATHSLPLPFPTMNIESPRMAFFFLDSNDSKYPRTAILAIGALNLCKSIILLKVPSLSYLRTHGEIILSLIASL